MRRLGIILIVACLAGDIATPLCPGAYRFDPAQSIEGVGSRVIVLLAPRPNAASRLGHEPADAMWWRSPIPRRHDRVVRPPIQPVLPRAALAPGHPEPRSPRSAEDG
jgi:hypothetical protein